MMNRVSLRLSSLGGSAYTTLDLLSGVKAVAVNRIIISPSLGKRVGHPRVP